MPWSVPKAALPLDANLTMTKIHSLKTKWANHAKLHSNMLTPQDGACTKLFLNKQRNTIENAFHLVSRVLSEYGKLEQEEKKTIEH